MILLVVYTVNRIMLSRTVKPTRSLLVNMSRRAIITRQYSDEERMKFLNESPYVLPNHQKLVAPPMSYISGEEMTRYTMKLVLEHWIRPHFDITNWEYFDLSCRARDNTEDQVLHDAVASGKRLGSIFKEPTITPTAVQVKEMGLKKPWGSPNGAMRRGWNGISISRDTIHIEGVKLGFDRPVLFDRHAVGGEYHAGWKSVHSGRLVTQFFPSDGTAPVLCDDRVLHNDENVVVTYHNPLDNVHDLANVFFTRCLDANVTPYVVTKKTVFKWQEGFWRIMKQVFDEKFKAKYVAAGMMKEEDELTHLISDAATMQIIRWTKGGFGMCAHNYDGDMLTDEIAQVHRSPGFITSNLVGKSDDGKTAIKEFEASHGTVSDLWHMHLRGETTSMNPLGMVEALLAAMQHSADLTGGPIKPATDKFVKTLRKAMHNTFRYGQGTKDMAGPDGLTTEEFIDKVAWRLGRYVAADEEHVAADTMVVPAGRYTHIDVDKSALQDLFDSFDSNKDGNLDVAELEQLLIKLNVAPTSWEKMMKKNEDSKENMGADKCTV